MRGYELENELDIQFNDFSNINVLFCRDGINHIIAWSIVHARLRVIKLVCVMWLDLS